MATIIIDTNSYVDVAYADAYFADLYGYDDWASILLDDKNKLLITGTQQLDLSKTWFSTKVDADQDLEFPRVAYDPTPEDIKKAQCEFAYSIYSQGGVLTSPDDPLTELKAGSVQLKFDASTPGNPIISDTADKLTSPYGIGGGNGSSTIIYMDRG